MIDLFSLNHEIDPARLTAMTHFPENKVGFHIFLIALTHAEVATTILRYNEWVPGHCYAVANVF